MPKKIQIQFEFNFQNDPITFCFGLKDLNNYFRHQLNRKLSRNEIKDKNLILDESVSQILMKLGISYMPSVLFFLLEAEEPQNDVLDKFTGKHF